MDSNVKKSARKIVIGAVLAPFILGGIIFWSAGTTDYPGAWVYLVLLAVLNIPGYTMLYKRNPELLAHRADWKNKKDVKPWDRILMPLWGVTALYVTPIVAGLDYGRYHWSSLGTLSIVVGAILCIIGSLIGFWAMFENTHFETIVRIQTDRDHKVISTGPYSYVRHPGYVSVILWGFSIPLMLSSVIAFGPAVVAIAMMVVRTFIEDLTLQRELPGYIEFTKKTRARIIPYLW